MERPPEPVRLEELLAEREWVRRMARALVFDEAGAGDLEQEAWARILRRPPRGPVPSVRGWLARVLRNTSVDLLRSEGRRRRREAAAARPEGEPSAADVVARAEILQRVVNEVMALEEPYRSTVLLRYVEDLGPAAIAARQGISVETVRTRLRRGLAMLRDRLDREHRGDRRAWALLLVPFLRQPAPAAAGATAAAGITGGILMALKAKAVVVAAVVLAAAGVGLWMVHSGGNGAPPTPGVPPRQPAEDLSRVAAAPRPPEPATDVSPKGEWSQGVRVRDLEGSPVAGAAATLHPVPEVDRTTLALREGAVPEPTGTAAGATTGADGACRLGGIPAGDWILQVRAEGFARWARKVTVAQGGGPVVEVLLARGCSLPGTVSESAGGPLTGVEVVMRDPSWAYSAPGFSHLSARTDDRGRWRIDGLAPGILEVCVRLPSGTLRSEGTVVLPGLERFDIVLDRGASIVGRVVDAATGQAVAGALVTASVQPPNPPLRSAYPRVLSGADGSYRLIDLPEGLVGGLMATRDGYLPCMLEADPNSRTLLGAAAPLRRDFRMDRGVVVRGRVTDTAGVPLPGAGVGLLLEGKEGYGTGKARTDPDGRYLLRTRGGRRALFIFEEARHLHPDSPPYSEQAFQEGRAPESLVVVLPESGEVVRDFALVLGATVEGRVVDAQGKPVQGLVVRGSPKGFAPRGEATPSAVDGSYRLEGVRPGSVFTVSGYTEGPSGVSGRSEPFDLEAGATVRGVQVMVRPSTSASLAGRVVGPEGEVVRRVVLQVLQGTPESSWSRGPSFWEEARLRPSACPVGSDGRFRVGGLREGAYTLQAEAPGFGPSRGPSVALKEGEAQEDLVVRLAPAARIAGRVVDDAGAPVAGAAVTVREDQTGLVELDAVQAVSDADGRFAVGGLAPVEYWVRVTRQGLVAETARGKAGDGELAIVLHAPGVITGVVVDEATNRPLAGIPLQAFWYTDNRSSSGSGLSRSDGTFTIGGLLAGPHDVTAGDRSGGNGGDFIPATVRGVEPGVRDLRVALRRGLAIGGTIVDEEGRPAAVPLDVWIQPAAASGGDRNRLSGSGRSREDGTFRIGGLDPGVYDIQVKPDQYGGGGAQGGYYAPGKVEGVPAGKEDVVVRVARGLPIRGRLVNEDGSPWKERGRLFIRPSGDTPDRETVSTYADPWGSFETPALRTGRTYEVVANRGDFKGTRGAKVEGVVPGTADLVLVLPRGREIAGKVFGPDGSPAGEGVAVRAWIAGEDPDRVGLAGSAHSAADGSFVIAGLEDRAYTIAAGGEGGAFAPAASSAPVRPGDPVVEIRLAGGALLEGRLVDEAGKPIQVDLLYARQQGSVPTRSESRPGADGRFQLRGFSAGKVGLRAYLEGRDIDLGVFDVPTSGLEIVVGPK